MTLLPSRSISVRNPGDYHLIRSQARTVLMADSGDEKCRQAHLLTKLWQDILAQTNTPSPRNAAPDRQTITPLTLPDQAGRPEQPNLVDPRTLKRRRLGSLHGRIALLHAIAHIEFNAINLACDMVARFAMDDRLEPEIRDDFVTDWVSVCDDEARHFNMINQRLLQLGSHYGALEAHDGLWGAARATMDDIAARIVIAPMVLEARGLDVTPKMIKNLENVGDQDSADLLQIIYTDEIGHVAKGVKWFTYLCTRENRNEPQYFTQMVTQYFKGTLKPPFNEKARESAGFSAELYHPQNLNLVET